MYDLIIIGGGPAGLSAMLYSLERSMNVTLLESAVIGGQLAQLYPKKPIFDFPGHPNIIAKDLVNRIHGQVKTMGGTLVTSEPVLSIQKNEQNIFILKTPKTLYETKSIILAIGMGSYRPRTLGIKGEDLDGVFYAYPDDKYLTGKRVLVVGGGESSIESALNAQEQKALSVTVVHRHTEFRASEKTLLKVKEQQAQIYTPYELIALEQREDGKTAILKHCENNEEQHIDIDTVCIHIGYQPDASLLYESGLTVNNRAVTVSPFMETSIPGIFACGDVTIPTGAFRRITIAQGQAATAVQSAYTYLRKPYWK